MLQLTVRSMTDSKLRVLAAGCVKWMSFRYGSVASGIVSLMGISSRDIENRICCSDSKLIHGLKVVC
jgi:hypothetical protein